MQQLARRFFIFLTLVGGIAQAATPSSKASCDKKELELRSCLIEVAPYHLRLTSDRATVNDGTWKAIQELPLTGDKVDWQRVSLRSFGGRWLVELEFWTPPEGPAEIQSLKWFVIELGGTSWTKRVEEIIQKRRRQLSVTGKGVPAYQWDRKEPYGIEEKSPGTISWTAGKLRGTF